VVARAVLVLHNNPLSAVWKSTLQGHISLSTLHKQTSNISSVRALASMTNLFSHPALCESELRFYELNLTQMRQAILCKVGTEITNFDTQKGNTVQAARGQHCNKIFFKNFFLHFFALYKFSNLKYITGTIVYVLNFINGANG
jgi:hypothetical protein